MLKRENPCTTVPNRKDQVKVRFRNKRNVTPNIKFQPRAWPVKGLKELVLPKHRGAETHLKPTVAQCELLIKLDPNVSASIAMVRQPQIRWFWDILGYVWIFWDIFGIFWDIFGVGFHQTIISTASKLMINQTSGPPQDSGGTSFAPALLPWIWREMIGLRKKNWFYLWKSKFHRQNTVPKMIKTEEFTVALELDRIWKKKTNIQNPLRLGAFEFPGIWNDNLNTKIKKNMKHIYNTC